MTKILSNRIIKSLSLSAVIGIGLASIIATNGNNVGDTQSYALAYSALSDKSIKVRWSVDGATWKDSNVPNQSWATGMDMADHTQPEGMMVVVCTRNFIRLGAPLKIHGHFVGPLPVHLFGING